MCCPFIAEHGPIDSTFDQLVVEAFQAGADADCQRFQLRFADFPSTEGVTRFAKEVLPHVR